MVDFALHVLIRTDTLRACCQHSFPHVVRLGVDVTEDFAPSTPIRFQYRTSFFLDGIYM